MDHRPLGRTGLSVSPIGFGAFKIGRNREIKYPEGYALPDEAEASRLLNHVVDLGINLIDTAPAYGLSEERIGNALADRRDDIVLCTKVGETFDEVGSRRDFSGGAIRRAVQNSLRRLRTDAVDLLLIHSDGRDMEILEHSDAVETLLQLRAAGLTRTIGLSVRTTQGARAALTWADVLMVEYHLDEKSYAPIIEEAGAAGVGILVKKGLAAGHLDPEPAIRFVLGNASVSSLVVGSLNLEHLRANVAAAKCIINDGS